MDDESVLYVPDVDDNRHSEPDEQWWVELLPMTAAEQRKYLTAVSSKDSSNKVRQANKILARIFRERVLAVHNLMDIKGRAITSGEELFENSETEYIDDVWGALTKASMLRAGLKN